MFQLPSGEYVMSQSQAAEAIEINEINARRFLNEKSLQGKQCKDYKLDKCEISSNGNGKRGGSRINMVLS